MDLVIGATGLVGGAAAARLRGLGRSVRAGLRGGAAHGKSGRLASAGLEVVDLDLTRPETFADACRGVETVVTTVTTMPKGENDGLRRVDLEGTLALIDAADRAGCQRFIYISFSGGFELDSPLHLAKRTCEKRLAASGMEAVILRPSTFMEIWLGPHAGFDAKNGIARIAGDGNRPIRWISAFDVATFVANAASDRSPAGTWELGGPEAVSPREVVRIFEGALGNTIKVETTPLPDLLAAYSAATDPVQKSFAALRVGYANGDPVPDGPASAARFGVELKSVEEFAAG